MRIKKGWVLLACLLLVAPTYVLAHSNHFPNDVAEVGGPYNVATGVFGAMSVDLVFQGNKCDPVRTLNSVFNGPTFGKTVSSTLASRLCLVASNNGNYVCTGHIDPSGTNTACGSLGSGLPSCCGAIAADAFDVVLNCAGNTTSCHNSDGFDLTRSAGSDNYQVAARSTAVKIASLATTSTCSNTVGTDLLPNWLVRVDRNAVNPNGVDGTLTLTASTATATDTWTLVTDPNMTDSDLHAAIADSYSSHTGSVKVHCIAKGKDSAAQLSGDSGVYNGPFVWCPGANAGNDPVTELTVKGAVGQEGVTETTRGPTLHQTPTLSAWGMAFLVAMLLLIGTWLVLRRRQAGQEA